MNKIVNSGVFVWSQKDENKGLLSNKGRFKSEKLKEIRMKEQGTAKQQGKIQSEKLKEIRMKKQGTAKQQGKIQKRKKC